MNAYIIPLTTEISAAISSNKRLSPPDNAKVAVAAIAPKTKTPKQTCWFCVNSRHPRSKCPAREVTYHKKVGHFEKICQSASISAAIQNMIAYNMVMTTYKVETLIDSGFTDKSFIIKRICNLLNLKITVSTSIIGMTSAALSIQSHRYYNVL